MKKLLTVLVIVSLGLLQHLQAQVDFRKETIYFLLTTRFFDGDSTNNRPNEWCSFFQGNPNNNNYSGPQDVTWRGDFKGLIEKLDYIKGMGFTAIWITPIVQNRGPLDYHGYHAWDFTKVDPRLESPGATFKDLVDAVHAKGMKIVLDIVTNHSGRFGIKGQAELKYNTDTTQPWGKKLDGTALTDNPNWEYDGKTPNPDDGKLWSRANLAKMPPPFNQDLRRFNWPSTETFVTTSNPVWFHQSGNGFAQGWDDTTNLYQRALADDCPDLNTGSQAVIDYMFNAYKTFLDAGVDAFRWDTWKHMSKQDIFALYDRFKAYKPDLFVFGEVAQKRHELHQVEEINPHWYTWRGATNASQPAGVGVLDFYAEATFHNIFEDGGGFSGVMAAARYDHLYGDPSLLVTWLDNHDFGPNNDWNRRYGGTDENLAACMNFMFTWRGIPSVYYGTESRFKAGAYCDIHNSAATQRSIDETGRAYFGNDLPQAVNHRIYKHLRKLNAMRAAIPALQNGTWQWAGNAPWNGVGFTRQSGSSFVCVGLAKDGNATFNFTNIQNGVYRDAVTGSSITVTNGSLQFTVTSGSAGIYVLNGPGMIGASGEGFFEPCAAGCVDPLQLVISPVGTNYLQPVTVTMQATGGTPGLTIRYTLDGSEPTASSPVYTGSFQVSQTTTVRAKVFDAAGRVSDIQAQRYTFELPPPAINITPAGGNYFDSVSVQMQATEGTAPYTIFYTTNGNTPDSNANIYTQPLLIGSATTVRAIARDANRVWSSVISRSYTFNIPAPTVALAPAAGNFNTGTVTVSLSASSPRGPARIYFTVNGNIPDTNNAAQLYTQPITLTGGDPDTLRYIAVDREGRLSAVQTAVYTFYPIPDIKVYFKRPANWGTNIRIHYWQGVPTGVYTPTTWPGVAMQRECGDWYSFTFSGITATNLIFNDGAGRQTPDLSTTTTRYYDNGWLAVAPDIFKPTAAFSVEPGLTGTAPFTVRFNGATSTACNGVQTYEWSFGNGITGSGAQPTTTYTLPGTYMVRLIVIDNAGLRDTVQQMLQVTPAGAGFWVYFKKPTDWANTVRLHFTNRQPSGAPTSTFPGVTLQPYCGDWYRYFFSNTTAVNLLFSDNANRQSAELHANEPTTFVGNTRVPGAPSDSTTQLFANFTMSPPSGRASLTVNFNSAATINCSTITSYAWNFGDNTTSNIANPSKTYTANGVYTVTLTVTAGSLVSTVTKQVTVGPVGGVVKVHFRKPTTWSNTPNAYAWATTPAVTTAAWPGAAMTSEGNGWFLYTVTGANCANIIFNNNSAPQTPDLLDVCGEQWYDAGWLSTMAMGGSLPAELLLFTGVRKQLHHELNWLTDNESGVFQYEVQRSYNGNMYHTIGAIAARNISGKQSYQWKDAAFDASATKIFYRLLTVDKDAHISYSKVVVLQQDAIRVTIAPNPATHVMLVSLPAQAKGYQLSITNSMGQVVYVARVAPWQQSLTIQRTGGMVAGSYYLQVLDSDGKNMLTQMIQWQ
ncbi:MAG: starch-binding protein [Chitinophagaceae bacterium]